MNERIKELKKQAWEYAMAVHDGHIVPPLDKEVWPIDKVLDEKFAELIVRECMDLALTEQKRYANISHRNMSECAVALGNFSLLIKDHFEDEE